MDGRGRLAGPVIAALLAGCASPRSHSGPPVLGSGRPRRWFGRRSSVSIPLDQRIPKGAGTWLSAVFLGAVALSGAAYGGHIHALRSQYGEPQDAMARMLGLGIEKVTISGIAELHEAEVLQAAGITAQTSLAFFDVAEARRRLEATPLISEASVRKLYPGEITIQLTEREPYALWQLNGEVSLIAADGTVIDQLRDMRFAHLPLVVGEGANKRVKDYVDLLNSMGPLQERVKGATLVSNRRWTFKIDNGVDVRLPELEPRSALERLLRLEEEGRILDRDILAIDLRQRDRVTLRLSEEAAAQRAEKLKPAPKRKGGEA
jgi:cell division protein FtsQ